MVEFSFFKGFNFAHIKTRSYSNLLCKFLINALWYSLCMKLNLTKIDYTKLNAKQQENQNFSKLAAMLADYGYTCIRLSDDIQGADLIARHTDGSHADIQFKGRFTVNKMYMGKNLYIAFPLNETFYVFERDLIVN